MRAHGHGGPVSIGSSSVGMTVLRQLMLMSGRRWGREHATSLVLRSVTEPSIVCVAPWNPAEPESWADRQTEMPDPVPCAVLLAGWARPIVSA
jgi:hypothetical protein